MPIVMDETDRQILTILLADARTPAAQIAEQIGLSRPAVADRIEKLERNGVINGTTAVINPAAVGLDVTAFVFTRYNRSIERKTAKMFRAFLKRPEVLEAHVVAGEDCYLLKVRTESIRSLNALVAELASPPLSLSTRTTIVLDTLCEKVGGISISREPAHEE
jgi:Transcriptional regulators